MRREKEFQMRLIKLPVTRRQENNVSHTHPLFGNIMECKMATLKTISSTGRQEKRAKWCSSQVSTQALCVRSLGRTGTYLSTVEQETAGPHGLELDHQLIHN